MIPVNHRKTERFTAKGIQNRINRNEQVKIKKTILIVWLLITAIAINAQQKEFPKLTGPYLGQKPPGMTPEIFAPGVISLPDYFEHSAAIFSPDGKEVYWTAKANNEKLYSIYFMKMEDGIWSPPKVASFCLENKYYQTCILSSDGKRLYFPDGSNWLFVEKQNGVWSSPINVSPKIAFKADVNICSVTNSGSVYFIKRPEFDVYVSRALKGDYDTPEKLGNHINSGDTRENSVFIAPDESYMIIEATKDAATCELFTSFKTESNSWSERIKLPIKWGRHPFVSPDGKYLFFMTRDGIYWVSAKIIEDLRPKQY